MSDDLPRKSRSVRPLRWGLWITAAYLVVVVPCAVIFQLHMQEYSPFAYIAHYGSYPAVLILDGFFRHEMNVIERLPHFSNFIGWAVVIGLAAVIYFAAAVAAGWVWRGLRALFAPREPRKSGA